MPKIDREALQQVQAALHRYQEEVAATRLRPSSKWTYLQHAEHFVRWLNDDFEPGINVR